MKRVAGYSQLHLHDSTTSNTIDVQELETLLEKGVIDEEVYDQIHATLPAESPLSGPLRTTANASSASPAPRSNSVANSEPPTKAFQNMDLHQQQSTSPAPPSYNDTPAPSLPARNQKPTVAHARALYRYAASDDRDLSFEKDDKISVLEYMNQDWWMGQNQRTGQEGIFPRNYVLVEQETKSPAPYGQAQQPQYGYPQGPPQQQNPYDANAPPMAVADGGSKHGETGKKVGKKFGNAGKL